MDFLGINFTETIDSGFFPHANTTFCDPFVQFYSELVLYTPSFAKSGNISCHEWVLCFFGGLKIGKVNSINFFVKIVARGNAVQFFSNFPAKRLSIFLKKRLSHLLIS